jgi:hypothetical protein
MRDCFSALGGVARVGFAALAIFLSSFHLSRAFYSLSILVLVFVFVSSPAMECQALPGFKCFLLERLNPLAQHWTSIKTSIGDIKQNPFKSSYFGTGVGAGRGDRQTQTQTQTHTHTHTRTHTDTQH